MGVSSKEARTELQWMLDSTVGNLLMRGLSWDQVVAEVRRRLTGGMVEAPSAAEVGKAPAVVHFPDIGVTTHHHFSEWPEGAARPVYRGQAEAEEAKESWPDVGVGTCYSPDFTPPRSGRADELGEPAKGSVVTDVGSRVWTRSPEDGAVALRRRAENEGPANWSGVVVAPADLGGTKGTPTVVVMGRGPEPATVQSASRDLELQVQVPDIDPETGVARVGPHGRPVLKSEPQSIRITEIHRAGER